MNTKKTQKYIDKLENIIEQDGEVTIAQQDTLMELYELYGITPCTGCSFNSGRGCGSTQEFDYTVKNYCATRAIEILSKE